MPDHPRPFGRAESALLPLVRTEAEHMVVPVDRVEQREADEAALSALDERRARLVTAVEERLLTSGDVRERLAAIEAERSKVEAHAEILDVPQAIDWDWEPGAINDVLHALWGRVDVDLAGATVEITWRDPSLRRG